MPGDFLDTNVLIYAASADDRKASIAIALIESRATVSVQVLNEFVNVARRKMKLDWPSIIRFLDGADRLLTVVPLAVSTQRLGVQLAARFDLHIYDATIAAAALECGCTCLMTEDMHDGLVIDGRLRIVNPFAAIDGPQPPR